MPEFMGQATLNELVGGFSLESSLDDDDLWLWLAHLPPADLGRISAHALLFSEGSLWAL